MINTVNKYSSLGTAALLFKFNNKLDIAPYFNYSFYVVERNG